MNRQGKVEQPDFPQVIRRLQRQGYTVDKISREVGISTSSLLRIKNEYAEPRYSVGNSLLILSQE